MLYKAAHERYQSEVIGNRKLYNRYVKDFLNNHTYTDCVNAAGMNEHKKNYHIMEELLTIRKDLVQKYFAKKSSVNLIIQLCTTNLTQRHRFPTLRNLLL